MYKANNITKEHSISCIKAVIALLGLSLALAQFGITNGIYSIAHPAYAQSTITTMASNPTTSGQNPSSTACGQSPQQSQGQIPPFCAKLIVVKLVDNRLGGTAAPSDFTL